LDVYVYDVSEISVMLKGIANLAYGLIQILGVFIIVSIALSMYNGYSGTKLANDENVEGSDKNEYK
jgi:hypothetical protein